MGMAWLAVNFAVCVFVLCSFSRWLGCPCRNQPPLQRFEEDRDDMSSVDRERYYNQDSSFYRDREGRERDRCVFSVYFHSELPLFTVRDSSAFAQEGAPTGRRAGRLTKTATGATAAARRTALGGFRKSVALGVASECQRERGLKSAWRRKRSQKRQLRASRHASMVLCA